MYDKEFVFAYDLEGKDVTVTIERVVVGELVGTSGKKAKKRQLTGWQPPDQKHARPKQDAA